MNRNNRNIGKKGCVKNERWKEIHCKLYHNNIYTKVWHKKCLVLSKKTRKRRRKFKITTHSSNIWRKSEIINTFQNSTRPIIGYGLLAADKWRSCIIHQRDKLLTCLLHTSSSVDQSKPKPSAKNDKTINRTTSHSLEQERKSQQSET